MNKAMLENYDTADIDITLKIIMTKNAFILI